MHNLLPGQLAGRSQFGWRRSHLNLHTLVAIGMTTHYGGSLRIAPGYCSQQQALPYATDAYKRVPRFNAEVARYYV